MEILKEVLAAIIVIGILLFIVSGIIHIILYSLNIRDKISLVIKLPKPKKYLTKVNPIYELVEGYGDYHIRKWELDYKELVGVQFLLIFIPYPIDLLFYRYDIKYTLYLCEIEDLKDVTRPLEEIFEEKYKVINAEELEKERIKTERRNKIDKLNKVFTENYE